MYIVKNLIGEDHYDTSLVYKKIFEDRGHEVRIENSGEDSLKDDQEVFQQVTLNSDPMEHIQPYDSVVLDYKIPKINAIEVGKDILLLTHVRE